MKSALYAMHPMRTRSSRTCSHILECACRTRCCSPRAMYVRSTVPLRSRGKHKCVILATSIVQVHRATCLLIKSSLLSRMRGLGHDAPSELPSLRLLGTDRYPAKRTRFQRSLLYERRNFPGSVGIHGQSSRSTSYIDIRGAARPVPFPGRTQRPPIT